MEITPGVQLGNYNVHHVLGVGGMGKVFLARDMRLGRPVALKVLPEELTSSAERLHRFEQEARLTSGLNHPNILTIYEVGEEDSTRFIIAEYVDGSTLRSYLKEVRPPLGEVVDIAIQIACALSAAHEAGVVHRDIKPENVMVRRDGYVKVLDFGLAKLAENSVPAAAGPEASTVTHLETGPGTILGTTPYMSPEQLRGQHADARSDIWSLGIMLFEMVAGRVPFDCPTKSDAIASILGREPAPLEDYMSDPPLELERIIRKALQKERDRRYQSVDELLFDLRQFKRFLDIAEVNSGSVGAGTPIETSAPGTGSERLSTAEIPGASRTGDLGLPDSESSSAKSPAAVAGNWRRLIPPVIALALVFGGGLLFYSYHFQKQPFITGSRLSFTRFPVSGSVKEGAISPDGRYIATIIDEGGLQSVMVRQRDTTSNLQLTAPSEAEYRAICFSPDGSHLYYLEDTAGTHTLFRVPELGGTPQAVASGVDSAITFSPGGDYLAFVRRYPDRSTSLVVARPDGGGEKRLATLEAPKSFSLMGFHTSGPAWSPDGKMIAAIAYNLTGNSTVDVVGVRPEDGLVTTISKQPWAIIDRLEWLADGGGLIMNAVDQRPSNLQLWFLSYPDGEAQRITHDPNSYVGLSATRDSSTLLTTVATQKSSIWLLPGGDSHRATEISLSDNSALSGISWTPDGRLVYVSGERGVQNLWVMNADGSDRKQLTFDENTNVEPTVSPDGRFVVFVSYREGKPHLWRIDLDGSHPTQLTAGAYEDVPQVSPDGDWIVYHGVPDGIWRIPASGGDAVLLTTEPSTAPAISPDGKLIACLSRDRATNLPWRISIFPARGGSPVKSFDIAGSVNPGWPGLRWAPGGRAVNYVAVTGGVSNVWSQPIAGGPAKRLTDFSDGKILSFALAPGTGQMACARGTETRELLLVQDFRQSP